jgi:RNA polymerase sigma-70 factor (ECF subfamily)
VTETSAATAVDHGAEAARLVARIQAGERAAEEAFVKRYSGGLMAILRVRCRDEELCRDVTQDTLRVVLVRIRDKGLDQPAGLIGFLRGTALNLLANEMRRSEHRLTQTASDWLDQALDESSDPYDTVEADDLARAVRGVIAGMKVERDRELLWRHYVLEDSKERLCAEFSLSAEHFDRVLHRARQRLKELLMASKLGEAG